MFLLILEFYIFRFLSHRSRQAAKFSCQRMSCITITKCLVAYFWLKNFLISTTDINNNKRKNNKIICRVQYFNVIYFKTRIFGKVQLFMFVYFGLRPGTELKKKTGLGVSKTRICYLLKHNRNNTLNTAGMSKTTT